MVAVRRGALSAAGVLIIAAALWLYGQLSSSHLLAQSATPGGQTYGAAPASQVSLPADRARGAGRDPQRLSPLQQHLYLSAQRGAEWLRRSNKPDGRFICGFSPSLRMSLEEDSYLAQIEATFALARSARFFRSQDAAAIARQALLTLLLNTTTDPQDKRIRYTIPPSSLINRPAAAGLLIAAVSELPVPPAIGKDLLEPADELANFLQQQLQSDGSLRLVETGAQVHAGSVENFSGPALLGIARSQRLRPAAWKLEALHKARVYYQAYWRQHKNMTMIADHAAACTEAFFLTQDRSFAEFVFEMNDWLLTLQYQNMDQARQHWTGGFLFPAGGKAVQAPPDMHSAIAAQSLADACRAAQAAGELGRLGRYKNGLESCLRFLTTLQYTDANTQHFAGWYRPLLVGGFHVSAQDGNLRLHDTQHAVAALVQYLEHVAEVP